MTARSNAAAPRKPHCATHTSATWAATRMVAKAVSDTVTQGAMHVFRRDGQAETELHHYAEEAGRNMEPESLAGRGVEPSPRAGELEKAQMGPGGVTTPGARSCEDHCAVECLRQLTLPSGRRHGRTQMV